MAAPIAFVEAEAGSFTDRSTVSQLDSNVLLLAVMLIYCDFRGFIDVEADLLRHVIALFDFLGRSVQLDCCDHFLIGKLATAKLLATKPNLVPILLQILVDEYVELLHQSEIFDISGRRLHLFQLLLLLLELPEPLVNLVLFEAQLFSQQHPLLSRWHLALILLELFVEHVHLLLLLAVATSSV